jgi:hypothetical protein
VPAKGYSGCNGALPAATDPTSILAKAGSPRDIVAMEGDIVVEENPEGRKSVLIGSAAGTRTVEHHVTHMPKNSHCEVCAKAHFQRKQKHKRPL